MRISAVITALVGVALAGGSVFLSREILLDSRGAANAANTASMTSIVVARNDIEFGTELQAAFLAMQPWPGDAVPPGAFTDMAAVLGTGGQDPRRAKAKLYQGEPLLTNKLSDFGEKVTIVQKLGENTRAISIQVDAVTGVGGFVTPGDFVDVLLTSQGLNGGLQAVTILQNIRVIGVDQQSAEDANQPIVVRTITVEISPEDGQKLALAQRAGTLSLTLRTLDQVVDKPIDRIELRDLMQEKSPVEAAAKKPTVTVRRGVEIEEVEIN